jgi:cutinase
MKSIIALALLATGVLAAPTELASRQSRSTRTDLEDGDAADCPSAILVFARGTGEAGNLGGTVGPALAGALEDDVDGIWIQGVGGPYGANTGDNLLPKGSSQRAIDEAIRLYDLANSKCPEAAILTAGYSQGAALVAAAVTESSTAVKEQIRGAALFGYTKNLQNRGRIPDFPEDRTEVFCNAGDLVCTGTLIIAPPHLAYQTVARGRAADFLAGQVN